jgi:hypothetical protein
MSTVHPAAICATCPQRATCRKLWQKGATCEHWPTAATPGLGTLALRAGTETLHWITAGAPLASAAVLAARQALCTACPHWQPEAYLGTGKCAHPSCHCTRAKLRYATSQCPMLKWLPSNSDT